MHEFLYICISVVLLAVGLVLNATIVVHGERLVALPVLSLLQLHHLEVFAGLETHCDELARREAVHWGETRELKVVAFS